MPKIFEYLWIILFFYSNEHIQFTFMQTMDHLRVKLNFILSMGKYLK